jgi:hypothetical protein
LQFSLEPIKLVLSPLFLRRGLREVKMSRARKLVIALLAGMALAVSFAPAGSADPTCQPGQNANPQPGFKPGGCK